MLKYITGVKNQLPLYYFERLSEIPRGSGNEKEVANYIADFARKKGHFCYMDEHLNVFVRKVASKGREGEAPILLQAHTDMVCEKNKGTAHDFVKDPIKLVQEGNILHADGTTLGADDGFGVSMMMAILDDDTISCPTVECLFTSSEEIGLVGASNFDYSLVTATRMINLDSAEDSTLIIGCCGGVRTEFTLPVTKSEAALGYRLCVEGLCGGHSGEDIDRSRLNAHILMGVLLNKINEKSPIRVAYLNGGDKDNAIPRECEAIFTADADVKNYIDEIGEYAKNLVKANEDKGLKITFEENVSCSPFSYEDTKKLLKLLSVRNGVLRYRTVAPILPELSRNLARIRTNENNVAVGFSSRCSLDEGLNESTGELDALASEMGAKAHHHEKYPGWESDPDAEIIESWKKAYAKVCGKELNVTLIHAGLECGIITSSVKNLSAVAVGCNVIDLHTPMERMELDSYDRIYDTLIELLK